MIDGFNFKNIDRKGVYGYWDHMDYIIQKAEQNGIYIAMVCIWGGLVRSGKMNVEEAKAYGKFLGERYKDAPNIIWVIGGDTYADRNTEIWELGKQHSCCGQESYNDFSSVWPYI
mgnify:FL=1